MTKEFLQKLGEHPKHKVIEPYTMPARNVLINTKGDIMVKLEMVTFDRKKTYHERLRDVFKACGYKDYTPLETGVALLIDDIIQEIRNDNV